MASFDAVNYSLRPSKSIQRQLVFEGVRQLQAQLDLDGLVYIGFGSIWFTDFVMAHKLLNVVDMVSIEANEIGYRRAVFNSPFATVRVFEGYSNQILPTLYCDALIAGRPWMIWLDYDYEIDESVTADMRSIVENAPTNSILLITFNGSGMRYGEAKDRPDRLRSIFGSVVPDALSKTSCRDDKIQQTLATLSTDLLASVAAEVARHGGFIPAFRAIYNDSSPMVTVGGLLPAIGAVRKASMIVSAQEWPCRPSRIIKAPHLTIKEATSLQSLLPCQNHLTRQAVQGLGMDLEDEQIEAFESYYRQYPAFAQIIA